MRLHCKGDKRTQKRQKQAPRKGRAAAQVIRSIQKKKRDKEKFREIVFNNKVSVVSYD